jgi:HlyD family secretion protein
MAAPKKVVLPILVIALAAGLGAWYALNHGRHADGTIRLSGNIETTEVGVSFKIPGRVEKRCVDEGDKVSHGQLLATLDTEELEADVDLREAELQTAKAALAELEAGSRQEDKDAAAAAVEKARGSVAELRSKNGSLVQEIEAAEAQRAAADVEEKRLKREYDRAQLLYRQQKTITEEQLDQARAAYNVAVQRLHTAEAQLSVVKSSPRAEQLAQALSALKQAQAQERLVLAGPRRETIDQARAKVKQAEAARRAAATRLSYAKVFSPLDSNGVVLSKNIEPGEYVAPGTPVITVADLKKVWLRAYVNSVDMDRIRLNQEVKVTTDASTKEYKGRIAFISESAEFTPKSVQTEKERVKLVYRIKINIDNAEGDLKPGMPADAWIPP